MAPKQTKTLKKAGDEGKTVKSEAQQAKASNSTLSHLTTLKMMVDYVKKLQDGAIEQVIDDLVEHKRKGGY